MDELEGMNLKKVIPLIITILLAADHAGSGYGIGGCVQADRWLDSNDPDYGRVGKTDVWSMDQGRTIYRKLIKDRKWMP